ncbi:MAG: hypothetical protein K8S00_12065, partial [Bacteroidales bacterium]|nr:hypothetical protein [Bacteroidales bacterium]
LLSKPSKRYESKINNKFYTDEIEILISKDNFNRFGYELTKTDTVRFNSRIESLIKFASRLFIANNNSLGISITQSIKEFQDMFGFTDDDFQYDTIKKDFDRHGMKFETRILVAFKQELKKIFLENLSEIGTVSQNFKNEKIIQQYE